MILRRTDGDTETRITGYVDRLVLRPGRVDIVDYKSNRLEAAAVPGMTEHYRPQLAAFFLEEVVDEQGHAQFLANKIVALGGEPTTVPAPVPPANNNREMLEAIRDAERQAIIDYTQRAHEADEFGDKGLAVQLEDMVRDESSHDEETEAMLRDWPL